ncbi:MAG TPA: SDR family NAD(P)-dependent oxidoreductase, partial [Burkholderiales bacterium]|nr:SDR family NAD(P)-dependent oxidoreductase [Burkholderiales bacterium]
MLEGKVALVTGAGGGIGRDFALAMAAAGAKVVVNDLGTSVKGEGSDASAAQKVVDEIKARGGTAVASTDSVSEWQSAGRIVQCALDNFKNIDVVVNNAGILRDRFFFNMSIEEWRAVIDVHLNGSFYVARAAAPHFKSQESGCYVHMTSTSGLVGNLGQANYSAAKLGIVGLSKSIALDSFGRIDVVVNNAGILRDRFFFNMSVEEWRAVIDVHLNGSFYVARAAAPHFKSQESGCYIHMTSTSGLVGNLGQANYSAAKLGIVGL